jgi:hypothetical protein
MFDSQETTAKLFGVEVDNVHTGEVYPIDKPLLNNVIHTHTDEVPNDNSTYEGEIPDREIDERDESNAT